MNRLEQMREGEALRQSQLQMFSPGGEALSPIPAGVSERAAPAPASPVPFPGSSPAFNLAEEPSLPAPAIEEQEIEEDIEEHVSDHHVRWAGEEDRRFVAQGEQRTPTRQVSHVVEVDTLVLGCWHIVITHSTTPPWGREGGNSGTLMALELQMWLPSLYHHGNTSQARVSRACACAPKCGVRCMRSLAFPNRNEELSFRRVYTMTLPVKSLRRRMGTQRTCTRLEWLREKGRLRASKIPVAVGHVATHCEA